MKKKSFLLALLLILALLASACGAPKAIPYEPYAPVDYRLYPAPEGAYVGDVMPFVTEEGTLELYYLYDTDHNGQAYHPIWKYVTADLCGYEDKGMMLNFGLLSEPDPALGTGSVMRDNEGLYHLFYTGHNDTGNGGKGRECVMHATSPDRENWTKQPDDTFFAPAGYSTDDFRDPEVFWMEEEGCYWLLIAARESTLGGVVLKYTSDDLLTWDCQGPIYSPQKQFMLECPSLLHLGDKWYLTYSWDCVTYYAIGDSPNGPFEAPVDNILDGGPSFIFYAAKTVEFNGGAYLCGWLGRAGLSVDSGIYQWAGSVLVHQLVQQSDGTLGVKAPESFGSYFSTEKPFRAVGKQGEVKVRKNTVTLSAQGDVYALADLGTRAPTLMLTCDVSFPADGRVGFAFGGTESDPTWTVLCLDGSRDLLHYEGFEVPDLAKWEPAAYTHFAFEEGKTHHVTLVCENEIVVLYVDNVKALSSRITHSIDGARLGLFADGCSATFSNVTVKVPGK